MTRVTENDDGLHKAFYARAVFVFVLVFVFVFVFVFENDEND